jgi:hypothetical protein
LLTATQAHTRSDDEDDESPRLQEAMAEKAWLEVKLAEHAKPVRKTRAKNIVPSAASYSCTRGRKANKTPKSMLHPDSPVLTVILAPEEKAAEAA